MPPYHMFRELIKGRVYIQFINNELRVFINGEAFNFSGIDDGLVIDFSNKRQLKLDNKNRDLA